LTTKALLVLLVLLALASCSVDDRKLQVTGACVAPGTEGLVADFSDARPGTCISGLCSPDLVGSPTVSLGTTRIEGVVVPYRSPGLQTIALTLAASQPEGDAAPGQALRAIADSGSLPINASIAYEGFALQFISCLDTSGYSGISFAIAGNLGSCGLRFAAAFKSADAGTLGVPCPIDECHAASSVPVVPGTTTLTFAGGSLHALAGVQWEVTVPDDPPGGCIADFTIDDIRLVQP
jgi:hypothetical protein